MRDSKAGAGEPGVEVYPSAPLRAVAIEVGFPALLDAMPRFGAFQRRHTSDFDRLYETSVSEVERAGLPEGREFDRPRCAVLMSNDRDRAVSIATDQLTVITYSYAKGFAGFVEWAMPMLMEGLGDLDVAKVSRVSYRYENRIKHQPDGLDLGTFFRLSLASPAEASPQAQHVHLYWHQQWTGGSVEVGIDGCSGIAEDELRLNITAHRRAKGTSLTGIDEFVRDAHRRARLTFEELITPNFRDVLRGKSGS